jgi:hypothetical protein
VAVYDVLATAVDRMVAVYREIERRVRELNPAVPRMEVLSLYEALKVIVGTGAERWRNLTYTRTTTLDEEAREMIWRLLAMYEEVAGACLREVENETLALSMRNTYLRGKASANFVMLNISPQGATIAPEVLLGELGVVVACAQQLYAASRAAPAAGAPG